MSEFNVKAIILLLFLSICAFSAHPFGFLDTSISIINSPGIQRIEAISNANTNTVLKYDEKIIVDCRLLKLSRYDFCGVSIKLGAPEIEQGLDLAGYDKLALTLHFKAPVVTAKIKVSFRNFNSNYAVAGDDVSLKFNSIIYNPNLHNATVVVPFNALQVDNWWASQYQVGLDNSQVDLSNISLFEVFTDNLTAPGEYQIAVHSAVLNGKLISEANLLKLIFVIWLSSAICLITLQRNKLKIIATTDLLTGLYNRRGISEWTNKFLSMNKPHSTLYIFYLDLDDFKKVNDTYGHLVGDELLIGFCTRIQRYLDTMPDKRFVFARLSGDEFTLITRGVEKAELTDFAENLLEVLTLPISLNEHKIMARASLGIALFEQGINTFEDLLARADSAMYYAKKEGKNQYKLFDESVSKDIFFRKQTAEKIKNALADNAFHLNFMPIFDSHSLAVVSVEVLLRTHAKSLEGIGPDIFIPIAEEYELIEKIDLWVIEATFKQITKERDFLAQNPLIFCINISAAELHNPLFASQLKALLYLYKIDPRSIEIELTETSLVEADQLSIDTLNEIRELGIKLALDDFGTGYTAFSQLINYPVDCLKIDKSFIDNLDSPDSTQATMIKAIIAIAKSYQLKTVAEGIEHRAQYHYLTEHGCNMMQGYLFAKPMIWKGLKNFLEDPDIFKSRLLLIDKTVGNKLPLKL